MKITLPDYEAIEAEVYAKGVSMAQFCRSIGIDDSTWGRWKRDEMSPSLRNLQKVEVGLNALRAKKKA